MRAARHLIIALTAGLALAGCNGAEPDADAGATGDALPELVIHRPFRPGPGAVNSYWLEGPDEILVFDTQGELNLAAHVVARIEETGKPVTAIVISHYHPDHFGGLQMFVAAFPDAQLLMTQDVADQIGRDLSGYVEQLRERDGDEFELPPEPARILENREDISISGVPVSVHEIAGAEASPITMLAIPSQNALLSSDLVVNRMHPNMADSNFDSWPRLLDRVARDYSGYTLYPGHGDPGPANLLLANQAAYLTFMRNLVVNDILQDDVATEAEITDAIAAIRANYPLWETTTGRSNQLRRNLEAIVAQLGGSTVGQNSPASQTAAAQ